MSPTLVSRAVSVTVADRVRRTAARITGNVVSLAGGLLLLTRARASRVGSATWSTSDERSDDNDEVGTSSHEDGKAEVSEWEKRAPASQYN